MPKILAVITGDEIYKSYLSAKDLGNKFRGSGS